MSSDSGESHSSAHNDHGDEADIALGDDLHSIDEQSVDEAPEGLTFARTRRSIPQQDAPESASELAVRLRVERAESHASTDIPDDTPSIQARDPMETIRSLLTMTGFRYLVPHKQCTCFA